MAQTHPNELARRPQFFALALLAALGVSGATVAGITSALQPHILESTPAQPLPSLDKYWAAHEENQLLLIHWKIHTEAVNWTQWPSFANGWEIPPSDYTLDSQAKLIAFSHDARLLPNTRAALLLDDGKDVMRLYVFNTEIRVSFENANNLIQGTLKLLPTPNALEVSPPYEHACRMAAGPNGEQILPATFHLQAKAGEALDLGFTSERNEGFPGSVGECQPLQMTIMNEGIWSR